MTIYPTVFHPTLYLSTDILLDFILTKPLDGQKVLELGCGSGFISLYLASNTKAKVYASDINPEAVNGLDANAKKLNLELSVFHSDLFDDISHDQFDCILVNPPYFEKQIDSLDEFAFFTGSDFAYFRKFFNQVTRFVNDGVSTYLIFSENVDVKRVEGIANDHDLRFELVHSEVVLNETFNIYILVQST